MAHPKLEALPPAALQCLQLIAKQPGIDMHALAKALNNGRVIPTRQTLTFLLFAGHILSDGHGFRVMPVARD